MKLLPSYMLVCNGDGTLHAYTAEAFSALYEQADSNAVDVALAEFDTVVDDLMAPDGDKTALRRVLNKLLSAARASGVR